MSNRAPAAPKLLKVSGNSLTSSVDSDVSKQRAEIEKILQDVQLVANRIAEARGESAPAPSSISASVDVLKASPFVSGLRALAESERQGEVRMTHLQTLLDKVTEYDRLILSKTAPPETTHLRRKSLGADLHSLPTHLRLVDRLLDLHSQAKRVTVIRTTESNNAEERKISGAEEGSNREDRALIESLRTSLAKANARAEESDRRAAAADSDKAKAQLTIASLTKEINDLKGQAEKSKERVGAVENENARAQVTITTLIKEMGELKEVFEKKNTDLSAELHAMKSNKSNHDELTALQMRLEQEVSLNQAVLRTLHSKAASVSEGKAHQEYGHLAADYAKAFGALDLSLQGYTSSLQRERDLLLSVKEVLENEVSSHIVQKDMLQSDLQTIGGEYEALKAAYHALSYESATSSRSKAETERLQEKIQALERELDSKPREMAQLSVNIDSLEDQIRLLNLENVKLTSDLSSTKEEVEQYKKLVESYKEKLRKASKDSNFLDTFEEVMQEEMHTMKSAFEAKLRAAREEVDNLSRKHALEVSRMQSSRNPSYTTLSTMANLNVAGKR